jgi:hypothetical protein
LPSALVLTPLLLVALLVGLLVPVVARLLKTCPVQEITSEWLENFSVSSYYPMEGLLNDEDFKFLSREPGFDLSLYKKLRRERLRIFKQYLNRSIIDFNRLHTAVRAMVPHLPDNGIDIVGRLIRLKLRFSCAVLQAQVSYWLCWLGIGSLSVRALISQLEEMSLQLTLASAARVG